MRDDVLSLAPEGTEEKRYGARTKEATTMTQRTRWSWATALSLTMAFCASLLLGGNAAAQEGTRVDLQLTPSRDSGVGGTAALTEVADGVQVELRCKACPRRAWST